MSIRKNPHSCISCYRRYCRICRQHSKHNLWYIWRRTHSSRDFAYYCLRNPQVIPLEIRPAHSSTLMDSPCLAARVARDLVYHNTHGPHPDSSLDPRFHSLADLETGHLALPPPIDVTSFACVACFLNICLNLWPKVTIPCSYVCVRPSLP